LVRPGRELVELGPAQVPPVGVVGVGKRAHRLTRGLVMQAVVGQVVQDGGVAIPSPLTQARQEVWRPRHGLHATGYNNVGLAAFHHLRGVAMAARPDRQTLLIVIEGTVRASQQAGPLCGLGSARRQLAGPARG
jgi:hypothetical protein